MNRQVRRDNQRIIETVKRKATRDMTEWLSTLKHDPTANEIRAFQAGYIAGINRGGNNN